MNFLVENWFLLVALVAIICVGVFFAIKFFKLPSEEQINKVKEWLVFACAEAEKELGHNTGQLKLRKVYDMFLTKFPWLAKIITFEKFSLLVDESLTKFKKMLETNLSVRNFVGE